MLATAIFVHDRYGRRWANPLDLLVLVEAFVALVRPGLRDYTDLLLIGFALLFYATLLYQQRPFWFFLPCLFTLVALFALPGLVNTYPSIGLFLGIGLPAAAVGIHYLKRGSVSIPLSKKSTLTLGGEWPLLLIGLLMGLGASLHTIDPSNVAQSVLHPPLIIALQTAALAGSWYICAGSVRKLWWLGPVIPFALLALLQLVGSFWVLVAATLALALLGRLLSARAGIRWALLAYLSALFGAILTGLAGQVPSELLGIPMVITLPAILLCYALVFYLILRRASIFPR